MDRLKFRVINKKSGEYLKETKHETFFLSIEGELYALSDYETTLLDKNDYELEIWVDGKILKENK